MKIEIYQAPFRQTALGFSVTAQYKLVWTEDHPASITPEKVWKRFQRIDDDNMPPDGYKGRSLSVGDVVAFDGVMFSPAGIGWKRLTDKERSEVLDT